MSLKDYVKDLQKKYGAGSIVLACDAYADIPKFSTGSLSLDVALNGGWAEGRMVELIGGYSAGKTTLASHAVREFMAKYPDGHCLYLDMEKTYDTQWAARIGVNTEKVALTRPDSGELAGDLLVDWIEKAKGGDEHVLFVVDSITAMTPTKIIEAEKMENEHIARHARLLSKLLPTLLARLPNDLTLPPRFTLMWLNQFRMRPGVMFGNPEAPTGGRAREHYASQQVDLHVSKLLKDKSEDSEDVERCFGKEIKFRVLKNKARGPQNEEGVFDLMTLDNGALKAGQIDNESDIVRFLDHYKVLDREGGWFVCEGKKMLRKSLVNKLREEPGLFLTLRSQLLSKVDARFQGR